MKRDSLFWGIALIILGVLLYFQAQGYIESVFPYIWPVGLMLLGTWFILGVYWRPASAPGDTFSIPLESAQIVNYNFSHGVGQLDISGGAPAGQALVGTAATGMNTKSRSNGDQLDVRVEAGPSFIPFLGPSEGIWRFQVTQDRPILMTVEAGASSININLRDVLARHLAVKTGASSVNITMPARGVSLLDVEGGATSVSILVPESSAARIRVEGVTSMDVDTNRFPRVEPDMYQSTDFDTAGDRAEINIKSGLGKISVR